MTDSSRTAKHPPMRLYKRDCLFCGGVASVRAPRGSSELDVDAEFSSAGRSFSDVEDGDPIGVACYRCARKRWKEPTDA